VLLLAVGRPALGVVLAIDHDAFPGLEVADRLLAGIFGLLAGIDDRNLLAADGRVAGRLVTRVLRPAVALTSLANAVQADGVDQALVFGLARNAVGADLPVTFAGGRIEGRADAGSGNAGRRLLALSSEFDPDRLVLQHDVEVAHVPAAARRIEGDFHRLGGGTGDPLRPSGLRQERPLHGDHLESRLRPASV